MITEAAVARRLQLDECWEVLTAEYEPEPWPGRFTILIHETAARWPKQRCPVATCGGDQVVGHDHEETRSWRHLDAFGKATQVVCAPASFSASTTPGCGGCSWPTLPEHAGDWTAPTWSRLGWTK